MMNCVAAIQLDEDEGKFILVSGNNRVEVRSTKALKTFVENAPELSADILGALTYEWFPDAEVEEIKESEVN